MPVLPVTELGKGPDLVLLHGVGTGPVTFADLAALLAPDHRVLVLERPRRPGVAVPLEDQAQAVADTIAAVTPSGRAALVGVSGGATLGLLVGIRRPEVLDGLLLHEPLVGRHAPALASRFAELAGQASVHDAAALASVRAVLGKDTWEGLSGATRVDLFTAAASARLEIPLFAAFDPSEAELRSLQHLPVCTTVGSRSGADRREAAVVLTELAGSPLQEVAGAGNAVQLDAPEAFADVVRAWRAALTVGCGSR